MAMVTLKSTHDHARRMLEAHHIEQAIALLQHVLEFFPDNLDAHYILGTAYLANSQFEQARSAFQRVLDVDPEHIAARSNLGLAYEREGKLKDAVREFEHALDIQLNKVELRAQLQQLYVKIGSRAAGNEYLSQSGLARLYAKGYLFSQAIQEFRSIIAAQPDRIDARIGLVETLWRDGQKEAALVECRTILAENSAALKANLILGYAQLMAGDPEGERYWQAAQRCDPYQTVAHSLFDPLPSVAAPQPMLPSGEGFIHDPDLSHDGQPPYNVNGRSDVQHQSAILEAAPAVPEAEDVPAAPEELPTPKEEAPATLKEEELPAVSEEIPATSEEMPATSEADIPAAPNTKAPPAAPEDLPVALEEPPDASDEDEPATSEEMPVTAEADAPVVQEPDELPAVLEAKDVRAAPEADESVVWDELPAAQEPDELPAALEADAPAVPDELLAAQEPDELPAVSEADESVVWDELPAVQEPDELPAALEAEDVRAALEAKDVRAAPEADAPAVPDELPAAPEADAPAVPDELPAALEAEDVRAASGATREDDASEELFIAPEEDISATQPVISAVEFSPDVKNDPMIVFLYELGLTTAEIIRLEQVSRLEVTSASPPPAFEAAEAEHNQGSWREAPPPPAFEAAEAEHDQGSWREAPPPPAFEAAEAEHDQGSWREAPPPPAFEAAEVECDQGLWREASSAMAPDVFEAAEAEHDQGSWREAPSAAVPPAFEAAEADHEAAIMADPEATSQDIMDVYVVLPVTDENRLPVEPSSADSDEIEQSSFTSTLPDEIDVGETEQTEEESPSPDLEHSAVSAASDLTLPLAASASELTVDVNDASLKQLIQLGQSQGFVDLNDIIDIEHDFKVRIARIIALSWLLRQTGIEIRNGDAVIDITTSTTIDNPLSRVVSLDEVEQVPAPHKTGEHPSFSLDELGLTEEVVDRLAADQADRPESADRTAPTSDQPMPSQTSTESQSIAPRGIFDNALAALMEQTPTVETSINQGDRPSIAEPAPLSSLAPKPSEPSTVKPFSLTDLGLRPEEIAALEVIPDVWSAPSPQADQDQAAGPIKQAPFPEAIDIEAPSAPSSITSPSLENVEPEPDDIAALENESETSADVTAAPSTLPVGDAPVNLPFSLEDLGLDAEEIAALAGEPIAPAEGSAAPSAPQSEEVAPADESPAELPFSLEDLGLDPEEIAALAGEPVAPAEGSAAPSAPQSEEAAPAEWSFSLADLGLDAEEIAALAGEPIASAEGSAAPSAPQSEEVAPAEWSFSLADLGLDSEESAALTGELKAPSEGAATASGPSHEEAAPAEWSFSLADLGLSPDEIAVWESGPAVLVEGAVMPSAPSPEQESPAEWSFSLADLGLSPDEIAALESIPSVWSESSTSGQETPAALAEQTPTDESPTPALDVTSQTFEPDWLRASPEGDQEHSSPDNVAGSETDKTVSSLSKSSLRTRLKQRQTVLSSPMQAPVAPEDDIADNQSAGETKTTAPELDADANLSTFMAAELDLTSEELAWLDQVSEASAAVTEEAALDLDALETQPVDITPEEAARFAEIEQIAEAATAGVGLWDETTLDLETLEALPTDITPEEAARFAEIEQIAEAATAGVELWDETTLDLEHLEALPTDITPEEATRFAEIEQIVEAATAGAYGQEAVLDLAALDTLPTDITPEEAARFAEIEPIAEAATAEAELWDETTLDLETLEALPTDITPKEAARFAEIEPIAEGATAEMDVREAAALDLEAFAMAELNLTPEEIAQIVQIAETAGREALLPNPQVTLDLESFVTAELDLTPEEIAQIVQIAETAGREAMLAAQQSNPAVVAAAPDLSFFTAWEASLTPEETAWLRQVAVAAAPQLLPPPQVDAIAAAPPDLSFFTAREASLTPEEIAWLRQVAVAAPIQPLPPPQVDTVVAPQPEVEPAAIEPAAEELDQIAGLEADLASATMSEGTPGAEELAETLALTAEELDQITGLEADLASVTMPEGASGAEGLAETLALTAEELDQIAGLEADLASATMPEGVPGAEGLAEALDLTAEELDQIAGLEADLASATMPEGVPGAEGLAETLDLTAEELDQIAGLEADLASATMPEGTPGAEGLAEALALTAEELNQIAGLEADLASATMPEGVPGAEGLAETLDLTAEELDQIAGLEADLASATMPEGTPGAEGLAETLALTAEELDQIAGLEADLSSATMPEGAPGAEALAETLALTAEELDQIAGLEADLASATMPEAAPGAEALAEELGLTAQEMAQLSGMEADLASATMPIAESTVEELAQIAEIEQITKAIAPEATLDLGTLDVTTMNLSPEELEQIVKIAEAAVQSRSVIESAVSKPVFVPLDLGLSAEEWADLGRAIPGAMGMLDQTADSAEQTRKNRLGLTLDIPELAKEDLASLGHADQTTEQPSAPEALPTPPIQATEMQDQTADHLAASSAAPEQRDFSFADLGLSEEEIAALGLSEPGKGTDASAPSPAPTQPQAPAGKPVPRALHMTSETTPLSLAELGLNPSEIAALSMKDSLEPIDLEHLHEELADIGLGALPPLLQPFKTDEAGSQQPIDLDQLPSSEPVQSLFDRLRQRRRSLTPSEPLLPPTLLSADDPEMAFFSEDNVSLRDDHDQAEGMNEPGSGQEHAPSTSVDPSHFSLNELSEILDEIASHGFSEATPDQESASLAASNLPMLTAAAAASLAAASHDMPDFPIFSIEDLGLTPEELVILGNIEAVPIAPIKTVAQSQPSAPAKDKQTLTLPAVQDAEHPVEPAPPQQQGQREAEASGAPPQMRTNDAAVSLDRNRASQPTAFEPVHGMSSPAPSAAPQKPSREAQRWSPTSFIPTGDATLDAYLYQLEAEPGNRELALTVAHNSMQLGLFDLAIQQYKHLIRKNQVIDQIIVELQNLIDGVNDQVLLTRLYRMLGDAYSRRGRFRDAITAYGYTVTQREQRGVRS